MTVTLEEVLLDLLAGLSGAVGALGVRRDWVYPTNADFVLAHGRFWTPGPLPRGVKRGKQRECYFNATTQVLRGNDRYLYCEGYAFRQTVPLPILHGWVVDRATGLAHDQTWQLDDGEQAVYYGVPFRRAYLARALVRSGVAGLLDRMETGWPLLTGADPVADAVEPCPDGARTI